MCSLTFLLDQGRPRVCQPFQPLVQWRSTRLDIRPGTIEEVRWAYPLPHRVQLRSLRNIDLVGFRGYITLQGMAFKKSSTSSRLGDRRDARRCGR